MLCALIDYRYPDEMAEGVQEAQGEIAENEVDSEPSILEQAASIFDTISRSRWWMSSENVGSSIQKTILSKTKIHEKQL